MIGPLEIAANAVSSAIGWRQWLKGNRGSVLPVTNVKVRC
jgi:hypothetical protein